MAKTASRISREASKAEAFIPLRRLPEGGTVRHSTISGKHLRNEVWCRLRLATALGNTKSVGMTEERNKIEPKTEWAEDRTDWAEDRTDWAEDRTILANERTFASWMRTGLAALAVAIGLHAVFDVRPEWVPKAAASIFIVAAVLIFVTSAQRSYRAQKRISSHDSSAQPASRMTALALLLSAGSLAVAGVLWVL